MQIERSQNIEESQPRGVKGVDYNKVLIMQNMLKNDYKFNYMCKFSK
jgi:hypothetical protein